MIGKHPQWSRFVSFSAFDSPPEASLQRFGNRLSQAPQVRVLDANLSSVPVLGWKLEDENEVRREVASICRLAVGLVKIRRSSSQCEILSQKLT